MSRSILSETSSLAFGIAGLSLIGATGRFSGLNKASAASIGFEGRRGVVAIIILSSPLGTKRVCPPNRSTRVQSQASVTGLGLTANKLRPTTRLGLGQSNEHAAAHLKFLGCWSENDLVDIDIGRLFDSISDGACHCVGGDRLLIERAYRHGAFFVR